MTFNIYNPNRKMLSESLEMAKFLKRFHFRHILKNENYKYSK